MARWKLDQISWNQMDLSDLNPGILDLIKTASLVEYNSADYTQYLSKVFSNDEDFKVLIEEWGEEEKQHGLALKCWAEKVDPSFDFEKSLKKFRDYFRVPLDVDSSVRGSRAKELVARCLIESGTSSYYSALADSCGEPTLRSICRWIAADEIKHFNLFFERLSVYSVKEKLGFWERLRSVFDRAFEVEDEELSSAYCAALFPDETLELKERLQRSRAYFSFSYSIAKKRHTDKGIKLAIKAAGLNPNTTFANSLCFAFYHFFKLRSRSLSV